MCPMPSETWKFTEKSFYLAEFRGRSLAIALPEPELASPAAFEAVLSLLGENGTRVVLLSPHARLLEQLSDESLVSCAQPNWIGLLWHELRARGRSGLCLESGAMAEQCREVALRLRLAKLVWIDETGGLMRRDGTRVSLLDLADLERLLGPEADLSGGEAALALLREVRAMLVGGVPSVNFSSSEGLADELFTYAGSGTFVTRDRYAEVRRLGLDEFDAAADLIARGVEEGFLLARPRSMEEQVLAHGFGAFFEGRYLAGIGSLLPSSCGRASEISSLYTVTRYAREGVGAHLMRFALRAAREDEQAYVYACTISERVEGFFVRHGFRRVTPEELPDDKWRGYSHERLNVVRCLRLDL